MSLIIKNISANKWKEKKQMYTWIACVFVVLLMLSIAVPLLSGDKKENGSKYRDSYYDLANMPFSTDAAADALMASARYDDIGKSDLINALFSKEDKEERQAEDEELGTPPPPDEDYKQAEQAKAASTARASRPTMRSSAGRLITPTQKGSLSKSQLNLGSGGGGGGVNSALPTKTNNSSGPKTINNQTLAKSMDNLNKSGRAAGFVNTYAKTKSAASDKDKSGAAGKAADAFQNGGTEATAGELEAAAAELGMDSGGRPNSVDGLGNLKQTLDDKRDKDTPEEGCDGWFTAKGAWDLKCFGMELGKQSLESGIEFGKEALMSTLDGGDKDKEFNKRQQKAVDKAKATCISKGCSPEELAKITSNVHAARRYNRKNPTPKSTSTNNTSLDPAIANSLQEWRNPENCSLPQRLAGACS